ncbi:MAG: hypothetical protein JOZ49_21980 [Mycolicibacterium sp.]|nr:hypothetical protein [Mycolicibacterium sp.]
MEIYDRVAMLAEASPLNYGVHLMITNDQWLSIKSGLGAKLGTRVEMRLAKPVETETGHRDKAREVPEQPGRALQNNGRHMLIGAPAVEEAASVAANGRGEQAELAAVTSRLIAEVWRSRGVRTAPPLRMLPPEVGYHQLAKVGPHQLALGVGEIEMGTVAIDLEATPHFYAVGRSKSGRSGALRTLCRSIMNTYRPDEAKVVLFDPNYQLADALDPAYVVAYASGLNEAGALAAATAQEFTKRRPPEGMAPQGLAKWRPTGPRWFIIVDDLNMLTAPGTTQSALFPLVGGIGMARQLKLHVLATTQGDRWHATGALNKVIQAMDSLGPSVLIMDGDKSEKVYEGVRMANRVPGRGELVARNRPHELVQVALPPQGS